MQSPRKSQTVNTLLHAFPISCIRRSIANIRPDVCTSKSGKCLRSYCANYENCAFSCINLGCFGPIHRSVSEWWNFLVRGYPHRSSTKGYLPFQSSLSFCLSTDLLRFCKVSDGRRRAWRLIFDPPACKVSLELSEYTGELLHH